MLTLFNVLSIFSKALESLINRELVKKILFQTDKNESFLFSMSNSDVFTVISEFASQTLDKDGETRDLALDTSKAIDRL